MKTRWPTLILSFFLLGVFNTNTHAQLDRIENKLPKSVPLKVEFKNYDKADWWRDLELKVTNTGTKPIYYVWLILWFDVTDPLSGRQRAVSFEFGDIRKFYPTNSRYLAAADDPAIRPGETYTFQVDAGSRKYWDLSKKRADFLEPHRAELNHGGTRFGDGSGLESGGSPVKKIPQRSQ